MRDHVSQQGVGGNVEWHAQFLLGREIVSNTYNYPQNFAHSTLHTRTIVNYENFVRAQVASYFPCTVTYCTPLRPKTVAVHTFLALGIESVSPRPVTITTCYSAGTLTLLAIRPMSMFCSHNASAEFLPVSRSIFPSLTDLSSS